MAVLVSSHAERKYSFGVEMKKNKAGYTANTSCGRVGRGANARFHTFCLMVTDGRTDGRTKALIELRVRN